MSHLGIRRGAGLTGLLAVVVTVALLMGSTSGATGATRAAHQRSSATVARAAAGHLPSTAVTGQTRSGRAVSGTFTPTKFKRHHGHLLARGWLTGTIAGKGSFRRLVTMRVSSAQVDGGTLAGAGPTAAGLSCNVLHLTLGPLDLNLLGLAVHLNQVVLDITAIPGAGNLLGNLLCAVAGLLDPGGTLSGLLVPLQGLLNQILAVLRGVTL